MANQKLSQLPEQTNIGPVDFMYIAGAGVSKKVHVNTVKDWVNQDAYVAGAGIAIVGNQIKLTDPVVDPLAAYLAASI